MLSDHYSFEFSETFYFMSEACFNVYNLIQPQVLFWWLWEEKLLTSLSPSHSARASKRVHAPFELVCILFLKPSVLPLSGSFLSACWSSRSLLIASFHKSHAAGNSHLTPWVPVEEFIPNVEINSEIAEEQNTGIRSSGLSAASGRCWQDLCPRLAALGNRMRKQKTG